MVERFHSEVLCNVCANDVFKFVDSLDDKYENKLTANNYWKEIETSKLPAKLFRGEILAGQPRQYLNYKTLRVINFL